MLGQSQSAPNLSKGKYRKTRAKNILYSGLQSGYNNGKSKLNIFCPSCKKMGVVTDVLAGKCCKSKDTAQKLGQPKPGVCERLKRRDEELLAGEVFFPKAPTPKYNPSRIVDLARPNVNNQATKRETSGRAKTDLDWIIYRASQTPGPGDHSLPSTLRTIGAKISNAKHKTEIDWIILNGSKSPGPGSYSPSKSTMSQRGGIISKSKPKSDVEWQCYHASKMPGPANYPLPSTLTLQGGRFNESHIKTALDWEIHRAAQIPGPGAHSRMPERVPGGRFGHATPSRYSKEELDAMNIPGPGTYTISPGKSSIGGRFAPPKQQ